MCLRKRASAILVSIGMLMVCMAMPLTLALKGDALTDYESYLRDQGFPESYWSGLESLHNEYPNWIFKAQNIGLDWEDVVSNESAVGVNLVSGSSLNSWKSCEYGAFDFTNRVWPSLDSGNWVAASQQIIAYYLDPRNFINDSTVFMFLNQGYDSSTQTLDGIHQMVKGTFLDASFPESGYGTYADVLLEAAKESGVSPYVLASSILQEQGVSGGSGSISGTYPGYEGIYNYFNVGAYATDSMSAIERGLWWAAGAYITDVSTSYQRPWNTRAKSIIGGAVYYGNSYVSIGQNNLYFKKFNVVHRSYYTHQYMTNVQGAESEAKLLKNAYASFMDLNYTFNIPVFRNMPDTAVEKPTSSGTNDDWIKALSVDGYSLTPSFSMFTTSYEFIADENTRSIRVYATPDDVNGWVIVDNGAGYHKAYPTDGYFDYPLADGNNTIQILVQAPSEAGRYYTLNVYKEPSPTEPTTTTTTATTTTTTTKTTTTTAATKPTQPPAPSLSSTQYAIADMISNVKPDTSVDSFIGNLTVANANVQVLDASGNAKTGSMATGDQVRLVQNGSVYATYPVSVNGDVSGDGKITIADLLRIQKYLLGADSFSGVYKEALDYDGDGEVTLADLLKVQKYILNIKE